MSIISDTDQIVEEDESTTGEHINCPPNSLEQNQLEVEVQQNLDNHRQDLSNITSRKIVNGDGEHLVAEGIKCPPNSVDDGNHQGDDPADGQVINRVRHDTDDIHRVSGQQVL
jgi:hypothetical protein